MSDFSFYGTLKYTVLHSIIRESWREKDMITLKGGKRTIKSLASINQCAYATNEDCYIRIHNWVKANYRPTIKRVVTVLAHEAIHQAMAGFWPMTYDPKTKMITRWNFDPDEYDFLDDLPDSVCRKYGFNPRRGKR